MILLTRYHIQIPLFIFIIFILFSCKSKDKYEIDRVQKEGSDSLAYNKIENNNDKIIWSDKNIKIYANHSIIEEGEEKLIIYSNRKDTLLKFLHEDGGRITFPFALNSEGAVFINFFEVWEGSGFLSKKNFYHLNIDKQLVDIKAQEQITQ